jgi:hypothetical protein
MDATAANQYLNTHMLDRNSTRLLSVFPWTDVGESSAHIPSQLAGQMALIVEVCAINCLGRESRQLSLRASLALSHQLMKDARGVLLTCKGATG